MSQRMIQKQNAAVLAQRLVRVEREREATAREKAALELAHKVLLEEPKAVIPCNYLIEFVPFQCSTDRGHCSECGGAPIGFTEHWKWCPLCGSQIVEVEKETNPHDRNIRERVDSALKEMNVYG